MIKSMSGKAKGWRARVGKKRSRGAVGECGRGKEEEEEEEEEEWSGGARKTERGPMKEQRIQLMSDKAEG